MSASQVTLDCLAYSMAVDQIWIATILAAALVCFVLGVFAGSWIQERLDDSALRIFERYQSRADLEQGESK